MRLLAILVTVMRIALITDIHGNRIALEAVLEDVRAQAPDRIVCLGDVAALGPEPVAAIEILRELKCPVVMGNTDDALLDPADPGGVATEDTDDRLRKIVDIHHWSAAQLSDPERDFVRSFVPTFEVPLEGGRKLLCCHGSPNSYDDLIVSSTPEEEMQSLLAGFEADLFAGGHTHLAMLRRMQNTTFLNPGSVGIPYTGPMRTSKMTTRAEYVIVTAAADGFAFDFRSVPFDMAAVHEAARRADVPHLEWWLDWWTPA